ncbi:MAG: DUF378 domain-containing protein [Candidatus Doudnabacteria bacterium]|nr:DUF378 domain-containing protein [Candidatus Doudnabacteria bacterium]
MAGHSRGLHLLTFTLLVIGGLNWLLLALFNWEVGSLFGGMDAVVSKIIYILVGLSAIYEAATHGSRCRACKPDGSAPAAPMNQ